MAIQYSADSTRFDWDFLRQELINDDFHNGRSTLQLRQSFENSAVPVYALSGNRCVGTARALSDGVCNAYVVDVWTHSAFRRQGIASTMMERIISACPGQHIYLFTDDAAGFYHQLGFSERPIGMELVSGMWLHPEVPHQS
jgi:GNAT superfamily N-acetyltransferase